MTKLPDMWLAMDSDGSVYLFVVEEPYWDDEYGWCSNEPMWMGYEPIMDLTPGTKKRVTLVEVPNV